MNNIRPIKNHLTLAVCFLISFNSLFAQTQREQDSLALVAFYNSTNGPSWTNNTNWLTSRPISEWYGITVNDNRVTRISLQANRLTGDLPPELGNLLYLEYLHLNGNQLTGDLPPELGNLSKLGSLYLHDNQLPGTIPPVLRNLSKLYE